MRMSIVEDQADSPLPASPKIRRTRFSRLNRQPGPEVFTKFADVKSRIGWTAERQQLLRKMWDGGDKVAVIAAALGCKVGAVNVARARFGLKPRRIVSRRAGSWKCTGGLLLNPPTKSAISTRVWASWTDWAGVLNRWKKCAAKGLCSRGACSKGH
jgi:hypothetical protein